MASPTRGRVLAGFRATLAVHSVPDMTTATGTTGPMPAGPSVWPESAAAGRALPVRLGLHLVPAVVTLLGALVLAPLLARTGWPASFTLPVAIVVLLTPVEFGILLRVAYRATGTWSLAALPRAMSTRQLGYVLLTPAAVVVAALAASAHGLTVSDWPYPDWVMPADGSGGFPLPILVVTMLVALVADGADPVPRPAENVFFVLVVQAVTTYAAVKLGGVWLEVAERRTAATVDLLAIMSGVLG